MKLQQTESKEYIDAQRLQIGKKAGIAAAIQFYKDKVPDLQAHSYCS